MPLPDQLAFLDKLVQVSDHGVAHHPFCEGHVQVILSEYIPRRVASWVSVSLGLSPMKSDWFLKVARSSPTAFKMRGVLAL